MLACAGPHGITITHYLAGKGTNLMIVLVLLYKKRQSRQILDFYFMAYKILAVISPETQMLKEKKINSYFLGYLKLI
jgi:hypothetical protein